MHRKNFFLKTKIFKQKAISALIFVFIFVQVGVPIVEAQSRPSNLALASAEIKTKAYGTEQVIKKQTRTDKDRTAEQIRQERLKQLNDKAKKSTFRSVVSSVLNTIAYDTASWLGAGGKGQKPLFIREGWGEYLSNIGDQALGQFIEEFAKDFVGDACNPEVGLKISLGMKGQQRPTFGKCSFTQMVDNWEQAIESTDFLNNFQSVFDLNNSTTDISMALNANIGLLEFQLSEQEKGKRTRGNTDENLPRDPAGRATAPPGMASVLTEEPLEWFRQNCANPSGDTVLVEAMTVFVCQLSYTAFVTLLMDLLADKPTVTEPYSGSYSFESGPRADGISGTNEYMRSILQPNFDIRGDYEILSELVNCPNPNKAGPTNCVITENFRKAISERKTVKEALNGYLNPQGIFGFVSEDLEPLYNEGYPYRSMIILRKFRILPVGWELAAEYIRNNPSVGTFNLQDLVDCYDSTDSNMAWCSGLVDPDWVLKAPLNSCKLEGPGPEIMRESVVGQGVNSRRSVQRNTTYCADEQSCIKERDDGSCDAHGYCTEEKRTWNFAAESCNPIFNTCDTFTRVDNDSFTVSYLQNTLDTCGQNEIGCKEYSTKVETDEYEPITDVVSEWSGSQTDSIFFNSNAAECTVDEEGCHMFLREATNNTPTYLKLLPDYLGQVCYNLGTDTSEYYNYKEDLTPEVKARCEQFVRRCNASEVGCELYTDIVRGDKIPAKITTLNQCPNECVGFDEYQKRETIFESSESAYFIPRYADTCRLDMVGCDEFTNLDEVARGGEGREYYVDLKQCVDPDEPEGEACSNFYIWEQLNTGPQLNVLNLKADAKNGGAPVVTNSNEDCTEQTFNNPEHPNYNPDCQEFLDENGEKHYKLYSKTITCSQDCHTYRRAGQNIDYSIAKNSCNNGSNGDEKGWSSTHNACVVCKNGGKWNSSQGACLYSAIPGEGRLCSQEFAGCREYSGPQAANVREIARYDFEGVHPSLADWSNAEIANEALLINGQSITNTSSQSSVSLNLGGRLRPGSTYILSFYVKPGNTANFKVKIDDTNGSEIKGLKQDKWQRVEELITLTNSVANQTMSIGYDNGSTKFYIDDFRLIEVIDRYYFMKDSFEIPSMCHQEYWKLLSPENYPIPFNEGGYPFPNYSLGCREYQDRESASHFLKDFTELCQETAVGCERMIDTHNYTGEGAEAWNESNPNEGDDACDSGEQSCVSVLANNLVYVVYDTEKQCNADDKGCSRFGEKKSVAGTPYYEDAYIKNNPDHYSTSVDSDAILCTQDGISCKAWISEINGTRYFKDPEGKECEWRANSDGIENWYQKKANRCDTDSNGVINDSENLPANSGANGALSPACASARSCSVITDPSDSCQKDSDCGNNTCIDSQCRYSCIRDNRDHVCGNQNALKTIGSNGVNSHISQPSGSDGWVGVCPIRESGCTEYIDPIAEFSTNLVFNPSGEEIAGVNNAGWENHTPNGFKQEIEVEPATLYTIKGATKFQCDNAIDKMNSDNVLVNVALTTDITLTNGESILFKTNNNANKCTVFRDGDVTEVILRKAEANYRLLKDIDRSSCHEPDFDSGCILFNERTQFGYSENMSSLSYNADNLEALNNCTNGANCDSNQILKVEPNRVCAEWLACRSMVKVRDEDGQESSVCLGVGACNGLDSNDECSSFVRKERINNDYTKDSVTAASVSNLSGYSKIGYSKYKNNAQLPSFERNDLFSLSAMSQVGEIAVVPNGSFEFSGENGYPIGWSWDNQEEVDKVWTPNVFKVINSPYEVKEVEVINFSPAGEGFIKIGSSHVVISEEIDVEPQRDYIFTAYINTQNLQVGNGVIDIVSAGESITSTTEDQGGEGWIFKIKKFRSNSNQINIKLYNDDNDSSGVFYVDGIKLRPALHTRIESTETEDQTSSDNWYVPQSCKLYPEPSSLACEYIDDSGVNQRGLYGYCLEYDRYPGDENTCLLWYPVNRVKGDWIEEGAGYSDRFPLYYCLEAVGYCSGTEGEIPALYCNKLVKVVTETGKSKFWYSRVREGSDHSIEFSNASENKHIYWGAINPMGHEIVNLGYSRDSSPYGSIVAPAPTHNPFEWDGLKRRGKEVLKEPLQIYDAISGEGLIRAGTPYYGNGITCRKVFERERYGSCGTRHEVNRGIWDSCTMKSYNDDCNTATPFASTTNELGEVITTHVDCCGGRGRKLTVTTQCFSDLKYNIAENEVQAVSGLKSIFAQSYGTWVWNGNDESGFYEKVPDDMDITTKQQCVSDDPGTVGVECAMNNSNDCPYGYCPKSNNVQEGDSLGYYQCGVLNISCCPENKKVLIDSCKSIDGDFNCVEGFCDKLPSQACTIEYRCNLTDTTQVIVDTHDCSQYNNAICKEVTTLNASKTCIGGENHGHVCQAHACINGVCDLVSTYESSNSSSGSHSWEPPNSICENNTRPDYHNDSSKNGNGNNSYCAVTPSITNIRIDNPNIVKTGFVNLTFNSDVNEDQLPLTMVSVDWGDGKETTITGADMLDRSNNKYPHSFYHLYDYWDLKRSDADNDGIICETESTPSNRNYCKIKPKVKIRDNWGWCNATDTATDTTTDTTTATDATTADTDTDTDATTTATNCNYWEEYNDDIKVYEK